MTEKQTYLVVVPMLVEHIVEVEVVFFDVFGHVHFAPKREMHD